METRTRKILFFSCAAVFIIACPMLLAYSIGIFFDFRGKKIVPTGSISIKSIPKKSEIYLNGALLQLQTPSYINNLSAGDYDVKVSKEGFGQWQKTLTIKNYQLTPANNILLLPQAPDIKKIFDEENVLWVNISPSKTKAAIYAGSQNQSYLYFLDLSINESPIVSRVDIKNRLVHLDESSIQWQAEENKISAFGALNNIQKGYIVFDFFTSELKFLTESQSALQSAWKSENPEIFIFIDNEKIFQLNTSTLKKAELADNAIGFSSGGNKVFYIEKKSGIVYSVADPWESLSPNSPKAMQLSKTPVPLFSSQKKYLLQNLSDKDLLITDENGNLFILSNQEFQQITEKADGIEISSIKDMLYYSGHEIYIFDKNIKNSNLIIRTEPAIKKALWFDNFHISYALSDGNFYIAELDGRNGRNILSPIAEKIDDFWIESKQPKQDYPIMYYLSGGKLFKINWDTNL